MTRAGGGPRVGLVLAVAAAVSSCVSPRAGGANAHALARPQPPTGDADAGAQAAPAAAAARDPIATLDELEERGAVDAPLMRVLARLGHAASSTDAIRAERDLCVRATFASSAPVRVWFADAAGARRAGIASGASGTAPSEGPLCVKRGEVLRLVVDAGGAPDVATRAVVFVAP